ncbi:MAG: Coupling protein TraD [Legionellaceae bacterium]
MFRNNESSALKYFTRGGQTFLHNIRMLSQACNLVGGMMLLSFITFFLFVIYRTTTTFHWYMLYEWAMTNIIEYLNPKQLIDIVLPNGTKFYLSTFAFHHHPYLQRILMELRYGIKLGVIMGGIMATFSLFATGWWLANRGEKDSTENHISGDRLAENAEVISLIKKRGETSLAIGNIPLPKEVECRHFLIHGSSGTGKSVTIRHLLAQIRARGEKAIIFDKCGDYMRYFYEEGRDIQLNPLDSRGRFWDLWRECRDGADYDNLAAALIPMPAGGGSDPFWINASRTIFADAAYQMQHDPNKTIFKLLDTLLTADLTEATTLLLGTEAESLISEKAEKMAISIKSVLATYLKSLKYLKTEGTPFSIREWIKNDDENNFLFITSLADQHETLKPLISMWLDLVANSLMSLEPSDTRRIWLILDELSSLHKLPYLNQAFAEARKFGGCIVVGIQSIAQLRAIYGTHITEEISGLCNTRLFFRIPTSDTAKWVSSELGVAEKEKIQEGYSYGENSMRSGVSVSTQTVLEPVVHYSKVMQLNDLEAYMRLPGDWPITKIKQPYIKQKAIAEGFIHRKNDEKLRQEMKAVDALFDAHQKSDFKQEAKDKLKTGNTFKNEATVKHEDKKTNVVKIKPQPQENQLKENNSVPPKKDLPPGIDIMLSDLKTDKKG